jgi:hypothetical protein
MNYRWLAGQLLATLAVGYVVFGEPILGVGPVYVVGIIALALLVGIVFYYAYAGYRSQHAHNGESKT